MSAGVADPLHCASDPESLWTTTNLGEAMPGVLTPLNATFWGPAADMAFRRTFRDFGAIVRRDEVRHQPRCQDRAVSFFYGRAALRVNFLTDMGDRMPGTSAADIAEQVFASVPPSIVSRPRRRYYPVVAVRFPVTVVRAPGLVRRARVRTEEFWRTELAVLEDADLDRACRSLATAKENFGDITYLQGLVLFGVIQPVFKQVSALAEAATAAGIDGSRLTAGYGEHEENEVVDDLWECSRERLTVADFVARHGYHGPREGEIREPTWRERPAALNTILAGYRGMDDDAGPVAARRRRAQARKVAETELLAALPPLRWAHARVVLSLAKRHLALRGVAKVAFLQSLDVARAAARRVGELLTERGVLADPSDVFFLTADEITGQDWPDGPERIQHRKECFERYQSLDVPGSWTGVPVPEPLTADVPETADHVDGLGVSGGVAEGRVRVVTEPGDCDLEPGEILVAHTTDPSWASVMFMSGGLVVDIGGQLSHAAVVARELGVPCVVNTGTGSRILHSGDLCRIDGTAGRVDILERAPVDSLLSMVAPIGDPSPQV